MSSMNNNESKEYAKFRNNLISLRKENNFTQRDVASKLNIAYQSYQAYERGVALPTLQNFIKLANLYEISLDELIGRKDY